MGLFTKQKQITDKENLTVTSGEKRDEVGDQDGRLHSAYITQRTSKNLLYHTGGSAQYSVMTFKGKEC